MIKPKLKAIHIINLDKLKEHLNKFEKTDYKNLRIIDIKGLCLEVKK